MSLVARRLRRKRTHRRIGRLRCAIAADHYLGSAITNDAVAAQRKKPRCRGVARLLAFEFVASWSQLAIFSGDWQNRFADFR